jgi:hypothetical protein
MDNSEFDIKAINNGLLKDSERRPLSLHDNRNASFSMVITLPAWVLPPVDLEPSDNTQRLHSPDMLADFAAFSVAITTL